MKIQVIIVCLALILLSGCSSTPRFSRGDVVEITRNGNTLLILDYLNDTDYYVYVSVIRDNRLGSSGWVIEGDIKSMGRDLIEASLLPPRPPKKIGVYKGILPEIPEKVEISGVENEVLVYTDHASYIESS